MWRHQEWLAYGARQHCWACIHKDSTDRCSMMLAGPDRAPQQPPTEPDDWRIGVRNETGAERRYRYGVLIEVDWDCYRVRFDDSEKSVLVPVSGHSFDWVQPDSRALAKQAQKGAHTRPASVRVMPEKLCLLFLMQKLGILDLARPAQKGTHAPPLIPRSTAWGLSLQGEGTAQTSPGRRARTLWDQYYEGSK